MNRRFRHLSQLLRGSSSYRSSAPTGLLSRLRTRSLEWKLAVLSDATENALRAARSQEDMVSFVSHQLQTPLASIRGFADLLGDEGKLSGSSGKWGGAASQRQAMETAALCKPWKNK